MLQDGCMSCTEFDLPHNENIQPDDTQSNVLSQSNVLENQEMARRNMVLLNVEQKALVDDVLKSFEQVKHGTVIASF